MRPCPPVDPWRRKVAAGCQTAAVTCAGATWRVMTWNVHGAAQPDLGRLADVMIEARPDAVAVQEIRRGQARRLATRLGWHHEWVFKHNGYWPLWWRAEGLAILAPSPLDDVWRECLSHRVGRRSHQRSASPRWSGCWRRCRPGIVRAWSPAT